MKKVYYIICCCVLALFTIEHIHASTDEPVKTKVDLEKFRNDIRKDSRSMSDFLEVSYDPTSLCIEVQHCGLGNTTIIIMDNQGNQIEETYFHSNEFECEYISLLFPLEYHIYIYSDVLCAIGHIY